MTCCPVAEVPAPPAVIVITPALVIVPASVSFVPAAVEVWLLKFPTAPTVGADVETASPWAVSYTHLTLPTTHDV